MHEKNAIQNKYGGKEGNLVIIYYLHQQGLRTPLYIFHKNLVGNVGENGGPPIHQSQCIC